MGEKYDDEIARTIHDAGQMAAWGRIVQPWRTRQEIIDGGATARMDIAMAQAKAVRAMKE